MKGVLIEKLINFITELKTNGKTRISLEKFDLTTKIKYAKVNFSISLFFFGTTRVRLGHRDSMKTNT